MSIVFDKAPKETHEIIASMAGKYYPDLVEAKAKIECLVARREGAKGEKVGGPAVRVNGYPCAAKIKINGLSDRTEGKDDATITIDEESWEKRTPDQRAALIDHELNHLIVMRDGDDNEAPVLRDKRGRPRMRIQKHDHQFGWFDDIAKRHGVASTEVIEARAFADKHGQLYFGFLPFDSARQAESLADKAHAPIKSMEEFQKEYLPDGAAPEKASGNGGLTMTQKRALKATRTAFKDKVEQRITDAGLTFTAKSAEVLGTWLSGGKGVMELTSDQIADCMAKLDEAGNDAIANVVKSSGL
jgi:hypothetical protein